MKKRRLWIMILMSLLLGGGGYVMYTRYFPQAGEEQAEPTLQTAMVTQGDLVVTADGSGELVPAVELEVGFRVGGTLSEMRVRAGDRVRRGDVLARLDTTDLERALAEAEVQVQLAQLELADVQAGPSEAELADARAAVRNAQAELKLAQDAYEKTLNSSLDAAVKNQKTLYDWYVGYYYGKKLEYEAGRLSQSDHDHAMNALLSAQGRWQEAVNKALIEEVQAKNRIEQARYALYQAQEKLRLLESEPLTDTLMRATLAVDQALLAREQAAANLKAAQLHAPFDGVVMEIVATVGEQIGANTPVLTLATLQEPLVHFWVEEADLAAVAVGNPVNVVFEALPDRTFTGTIVRVSPMLTTVGNTPAVEAWARLDLGAEEVSLLAGMTASVEVIAAQAQGVLLVPVEALRETAPGQHTVTVIRPDGTQETRAVRVGLTDGINAAVLEGLALGEVVSLE
ncbi:MAG: efflux RND transporter periplasmic adaptor subunit [Anaerolineae bacterium]|nr:efflux RND transporter periplasmic adaptor subunit [Anaerolineae bacterium]